MRVEIGIGSPDRLSAWRAWLLSELIRSSFMHFLPMDLSEAPWIQNKLHMRFYLLLYILQRSTDHRSAIGNYSTGNVNVDHD
jgi:hypothetical protein